MIRAFQWDLGRQIERLDWLLAQLPRYADWGYTELYLHLEDAVQFPSVPGVARPGAYSTRQLGKLVDKASRVGIGVVPIVNLLGHTQYLIKVPELRELNELLAPDGTPLPEGQVCPLLPRTLGVATALIADMAPFCTAGKIHVGLDESFLLGRHPLSRAEVEQVGLAAHFGRYVRRLGVLAADRGLRLGYWADMLALLPGAVAFLPPGSVAYDWYYYPFGRAPRMELHNFAEYDLVPALRAQGVEYWGCPMSGSFRHEPLPVFGERLANIRSWWDRCQRVSAAGILITNWEPQRLALPLTTVVDAAAASLWLRPVVDDIAGMLAQGFSRVFGPARAHEFARSALACDERAFVGNARWEVNERWDVASLRQGTSRFESERSFYARLSARKGLPPPLRESARLRLYLAERDVFVRSAAAHVLALRRRLSKAGPADPAVRAAIVRLLAACRQFGACVTAGRRAARAVWSLTRDRGFKGPNERIIAADARRLSALMRWLERCRTAPAQLHGASPVCGAWELRLDVVLTEPALQRVVVEAADAAGAWTALHARTAIEFRAQAAQPRTLIRRELRVPVPRPSTPLRVALRGLGRVTVANIELTDGVSSFQPAGIDGRGRVLGAAAPASGFPDLDWTRDTDALALDFSKKKRRPR